MCLSLRRLYAQHSELVSSVIRGLMSHSRGGLSSLEFSPPFCHSPTHIKWTAISPPTHLITPRVVPISRHGYLHPRSSWDSEVSPECLAAPRPQRSAAADPPRTCRLQDRGLQITRKCAQGGAPHLNVRADSQLWVDLAPRPPHHLRLMARQAALDRH